MMISTTNVCRVLLAGCLLLGLHLSAKAQDLEPKFLSNAPKGMHFIVFGYSYSSGNVLLDPSLPIEDADAVIHSFSLAYATTFGLFGRLAKFDVILPLSLGDWKGLVDGIPASRSADGFGDPLLRVAVNLIGSPALTAREFVLFKEKFVLGLSLRVQAPLGQYDETKLINLGAHRWTFAPKLGAGFNWRKWGFEAYLSGWFFTRNDRFFNGNTLSQDPLYALQIHAAYSFRPGLWLAVSLGRGTGGETVVNGVPKKNDQNNTRAGATLSLPIRGPHSLKLAYSKGVSTRFGADFSTVVLAYQYRFGGR